MSEDLELETGAAVVKALTLGGEGAGEVQPSNALPAPDEEARRLERAGALAPPFPPHWLAVMVEKSTALMPARAALMANVDGHGYRFEPRVVLDSSKLDKQIAE